MIGVCLFAGILSAGKASAEIRDASHAAKVRVVLLSQNYYALSSERAY